MIDLTPHLNILGLPPDATWDQVEHRYRTLVIFWHPDRVSSPHHKALAEEELKKINNAKDKLKQHWREWQNRSRSTNSHGQGSSSQASSAHAEEAKQKEQEIKRAADEARRKREAEKRYKEDQRRQQYADFEAAYQHYADSRSKDETLHRLGLRLVKAALLSSAGLLITGLSSQFITNHWTNSLTRETESWSLSKKGSHLYRRYQQFREQPRTWNRDIR